MNVALIGLGRAGMHHAGACRAAPEVTLLAVADPSPKAADAASKLGIPWFSNHRVMLDKTKPSAAIVCVPHNSLSAIAVECANRGLHVLLEKPMGVTVAEAATILEAAATANVRLMVNFVHRFRAEYRQAKSFIDAGTIGHPVIIEDSMTWGRSQLPAWVWQHPIAGGGLMMYNGIHSLDRLAWLAGSPIARVTAAMGSLCYPVEVEDNLVGTVVFESGKLGVVIQHKSDATTTLNRWETMIWGTEGALKISGGTLQVISTRERVQLTVPEDDRFMGALLEFVGAVEAKRDPVPSGKDGLHALAAVMAMYEAARTGRAQVVSDHAHAASLPTASTARTPFTTG